MGVVKSGSNGNTMDVNSNSQAEVNAETKGHDHVKNEKSGEVWSIPFEDVDPTAANDNFIYIKNNSTSRNLEITDVRITSTVVGQIKINQVSGTVSGGTDITPVSRNTGKSVLPTATIQSGADLTGLTDIGTYFFMQIYTANKEEHLRTSSRLIIAPNGAVALQWEPSTGALTGIISINEDEIS